MKKYLFPCLLLGFSFLIFTSCSLANKTEMGSETEVKTTPPDLEGLSTAYFGSGCFWCVEAVFESVKGVEEAVSGYAGGHTKNPTYQTIGTGRTGHAEVVEVYYNPAIINYQTLVEVYYGSHDPTTANRQGPDAGSQYRSLILYQNEEEKKIATQYKEQLADSGEWEAPIVTEIVPLKKFYKAEDYHQNYERLHPTNSYVRNVSIPRLNRFKERYPHLLKESH